MYCRRCGLQISEDSDFCQHCGSIINAITTVNKNPEKTPSHTNGLHRLFQIANKNLPKIYLFISLLTLTIIIIILFNNIGNTNSRGVSTNNKGQNIANQSRNDIEPTNIEKNKEVRAVNLVKSVLLLNIYDEYNKLIGNGSGFVAINDSTIITNYHVIDGAYSIEVVSENDVKYTVKGVISYNEEYDLAILKLNKSTNLPVLPIANSDDIQVEDKVIAIGSPLGLKNTVSNGIISAIRNEKLKEIQITAPISPGSSGGALFNSNGEIIGITYAGIEGGQNLNLAIPSNQINKLVPFVEMIELTELYKEYMQISNSPFNIAGDGKIVENDDYIFHCFEKYRITRVNKKSLDDKLFIDNGKMLNIYKGKLYYFNMDNSVIMQCDLKGGNKIELIKVKKDNSLNFFITRNKVYVHNIEGLISYSLDGHLSSRISSNPTTTDEFTFNDNALYFTDKTNSNKYVLRILDFDKQEIREIELPDIWSHLSYENGILYGSTYNSKIEIEAKQGMTWDDYYAEALKYQANIFSLDIETGKINTIKKGILDFIIIKGKIYFNDAKASYSMKVDGSNFIKYGNYRLSNLNIYGNNLYAEGIHSSPSKPYYYYTIDMKSNKISEGLNWNITK